MGVSDTLKGGGTVEPETMVTGAATTESFGAEDLEKIAPRIPLHTTEPGLIPDSGDLCDSDCQDCD